MTPTIPEPDITNRMVRVDIATLVARAIGCVVGLAALGAVGGLVWGVLAPGVTGLVVAPGRTGYLGMDTTHRFDAVALFACVAAVVGIIGTLAVWAVRSVRGPLGVATSVVGSMIGSAMGAWLGGLVAGARHPGPGRTPVGQYFTASPGVRLPGAEIDLPGVFGADVSVSLSWSIVVVAPVAAVLTLVVLVLAGRADLGVPVGDEHRASAEPGTAESNTVQPGAAANLTEGDAASRTRR